MPEEWIIQVEGREYGPVDLQILREWKEEGRVLPANQARRAEGNTWMQASEIPGLFETFVVPGDIVAAGPHAGRTFTKILSETFRIYRQGFFQFLCLTLVVIIPSLCAQLTSAVLDTSPAVDADLRTMLAGGFSFCMLLLSLALWPIYVSGIQLLSARLIRGDSGGFFPVLNEAVRIWPRVAVLCVFVYGSYVFWTVLPIVVIMMITLGAPSVASFFLALLVLAFQVWIVGRLYVNFMFWQQFAVLAGNDAGEALRNSKALARSQRNAAWYKRPLWRGVFIASIWFLFVLAIAVGPQWATLRHYFNELMAAQDPQALLHKLSAAPPLRGFNILNFALVLLQRILQPLLGIAFVVLYFDAEPQEHEQGG
jgi:hypothetical protein